MYIDRDLLRQCSSDDAVNLLVDIQFGQTAALGVVGYTDGHWFRPLGDWHSDLKQLQRVVKKQRELKECILICTVKIAMHILSICQGEYLKKVNTMVHYNVK